MLLHMVETAGRWISERHHFYGADTSDVVREAKDVLEYKIPRVMQLSTDHAHTCR